MYLQYFGLKEPPFSIAPNPRYLFMSERHREALAHLVYGLQGAGGFVVLTGEVGAGKTTLARRFLEEIPANCRVAYLINPNVTTTELLQTICDEFGIKVKRAARRDDEAPSNKGWVDAINAFLLSEYAAGRNCVVLVDEAQNLTPEVMEQLRLLTNLETDERKLLQIILIGQPELRDLLARHDLRQVDQRVVARYHLDSLGAQDTEHYLAHRLGIAGGQADLFAPAAASAVHTWTHGVPRRINVLADRALLGAYAQGEPQVTEALVNTAAGEVFQPKLGKAGRAALGANDKPNTGSLGKLVPWLGGGITALALAYALVNIMSSGLLNFKAAPLASAQQSPAVAPVIPDTPKRNVSDAEVIIDKSSVTAASNSILPVLATPSLPLKALALAAAADAKARAAPALALLQKWGVPTTALDAKLAASASTPALSKSLCEAAQKAQLACYASKAGLDVLRANNHPALLTLVIDGNTTVPALLEKLSATSASLMVGNTRSQVPLAELAQAWQGDFVSLWKPLLSEQISEQQQGLQKPPVSNLNLGASGPAVAELLDRLKRVQPLPVDITPATTPEAARYDAKVQAVVRAFQMSQGLLPDGGAGPQTLLRLNALALPEALRLADLQSR